MKTFNRTKILITIIATGVLLLAFIGLVAWLGKSSQPPDAKTQEASQTEENAAPAAAIDPNAKVDVIVNGFGNGPMFFDVITNFDAGKKLIIILEDEDDFRYAEEVTVLEDGIAHTGPVTDNEEHLKGLYNIVVVDSDNSDIRYYDDEYRIN